MQHTQLCRLIDESIRPFTDQFAFCLTKETEKNLLIVLSQGMVVKVPVCNNKCSVGSHCDDHNCLTKIIGDLVMDRVQRVWVQLPGLSQELLQKFREKNIDFAAHNAQEDSDSLLRSSEGIGGPGGPGFPLAFGQSKAKFQMEPNTGVTFDDVAGGDEAKQDFMEVVEFLKKPERFTAVGARIPKGVLLLACIIRVLRNILKCLKQDIDDQLLKVYLNSISYCLASVPWDSMDEVHVGRNGDALRKSSEDAFHTKAVELESSIVFRGTLVQLFCSLLNQSGWMEAAGGALNKHPVICEISNLIPRLLTWCLCDGDSNNMCMSVYFRHKMLLMHEYFEDLLMQPMTQLESDQEDILEGSPFLVSVSDARIHNVTSRHLQRDKTADQCGCANLKSCLKSDSSSDLECYSRKKGLSELYGCLQGHLPAEMFIGCKFYSERCTSFSLSFLRLFIHEDDILFEVLLQLFHVSFGGKQQLHHDHQVLLDYLISKDTGAKAAEYLLSSPCVLYVIRGTHLWNFQQKGKLQMKRKVLVDDSLIEGHLTSSSMKSKGIRLSLGKQCQKDLMRGSKHCRTTRLPFGNAKDCLLSLKKSLQNLHKKSLFPYNPQVLLQCAYPAKVFLMVAQNSFGGCGSPELKWRRWRRKRGTLSLFTRLQSFLRLGGQKVTDLDFTFFAYRSKWLDKSPHSWILYGVDGVHGVSPSDDKMILVGLSIVISHLLLWSGSLPQRSAVVCHCSYAGF
ncbi:unnamed protein product [Camellia sinensis]